MTAYMALIQASCTSTSMQHSPLQHSANPAAALSRRQSLPTSLPQGRQGVLGQAATAACQM